MAEGGGAVEGLFFGVVALGIGYVLGRNHQAVIAGIVVASGVILTFLDVTKLLHGLSCGGYGEFAKVDPRTGIPFLNDEAREAAHQQCLASSMELLEVAPIVAGAALIGWLVGMAVADKRLAA